MSVQSEDPSKDSPVIELTAVNYISLFQSALDRKKLLIGLIVLLYGMGNLIVPRFLSSHTELDVFDFFFAGALATEIGLLAAGVAFTRGSIVASFTVNSLLMVFMCASYIFGMRSMPRELPIVIFGLGFGRFIATVLVFLAIRWCWKLHFENATESKAELDRLVKQRNYSIRYIMLTTAAIAIAICVVSWTLPKDRYTSNSMPPVIVQIIAVCTIEIVASIFALYLCISIVLMRSVRSQVGSVSLLVLFCVLFPYLNAVCVQFFTRALIYQYLHLAYAYIAGLVFFSTITLSLLRFVGYRIVRDSPQAI